MKSSARYLVLALGLLLPNGLAHGQTATNGASNAISAAQTGWVVGCDNLANAEQLACVMSIRITQRSSNRRIVAIRIPSGSGERRGVLELPHGIALEGGVTVSVDGVELAKVPIVRADANGAYAELIVDSDVLERMKLGNTARLTMKILGGGPLNVDVPLTGFSRSLTLMSKVLP